MVGLNDFGNLNKWSFVSGYFTVIILSSPTDFSISCQSSCRENLTDVFIRYLLVMRVLDVLGRPKRLFLSSSNLTGISPISFVETPG